LFDESEEFGRHKGLGILPGRVKRFKGRLKIPHMGWNQVEFAKTKEGRAASLLLKGIPDKTFFYFVHSYYVVPDNAADTKAFTRYGILFTSIVVHDNIYACQFHPEKSQSAGLRMLKNFAGIKPC